MYEIKIHHTLWIYLYVYHKKTQYKWTTTTLLFDWTAKIRWVKRNKQLDNHNISSFDFIILWCLFCWYGVRVMLLQLNRKKNKKYYLERCVSWVLRNLHIYFNFHQFYSSKFDWIRQKQIIYVTFLVMSTLRYKKIT